MVPHKAAAPVLERAAEKLGGMNKLAGRLGVDALDLQQYLRGEADMPEPLYLRVVDIVLDGSEKPT